MRVQFGSESLSRFVGIRSQRSKQSLSAAVFGKQVSVESSKRDRYGRDIGKITVDGQDANLGQIRQGMAWHYKAYEKEQSPADRSA